MSKSLKAVLERAETWPQWAKDDLAELAREIDGQVSAGTYRATREELAKIDEALAARAARRGCDHRGRRGGVRQTLVGWAGRSEADAKQKLSDA